MKKFLSIFILLFVTVVYGGNLIIKEFNKIYLKDPTSVNKIGIAPPALSTSWNATLPINAGSSGQLLSTDGSGNLSWTSAGPSSQWTTSGADIYYNTGRVGIGLTTPLDALHVNGSIMTTGIQDSTSTNKVLFSSLTDVLSGGVASASSTYSGSYVPSNAVDNSLATRWATVDNGIPGWWKYDLGIGITKVVTEVSFNLQSTETTNNFTVDASNDDLIWATLYTGVGLNNNSWQTFTFANSTAYRYYRISVSSVHAGIVVSFSEIRMRASVSPNPISFTANGISNAMILATNGNVGIGTNNSGAKLNIGNQVQTIQMNAPSAGSQQYMTFTDNSTYTNFLGVEDAGGTGIFGTGLANAFVFGTNAGQAISFVTSGIPNRMVIAPSGNVGIQNASPGAPLQVGSNNTPIAGATKTAEFANSIVVGNHGGGGYLLRNAGGTGHEQAMGLGGPDELYIGYSTPLMHFRTNTNIVMNLTSNSLDMLGNKVVGVANGTASTDAVNYSQLSAIASGLIWKDPIHLINMVDDSLTAPPVTPAYSDAYLVALGGSGAWFGKDGHIEQWDGSAWVDEGLAAIGSRYCISCETPTAGGGTFLGQDDKIYTITNVTPGSYAYAAAYSPSNNDAVFVNNPNALHYGHSYVYSTTSVKWTEFSGPASLQIGNALAFTGNILNVLFDNSTIGLNSNQLEVKSNSLTNTQINSSAGISYSKMAALNAERVLVSNTSGVLTSSRPIYYDNTNNKLSLNDTTFVDALTIVNGGALNNGIAIQASSNATGDKGSLHWYNESGFEAAFIKANRTNVPNAPHDLVFGTANASPTAASEKMRITSGGNVGVGNANPDSALIVTSSLAGNYGVGIPDFGIGGNVGGASTALTMYRSAATNGYIGIDSYRSFAGAAPLVINAINSGFVGINTTTPNYALEVGGIISSTVLPAAPYTQPSFILHSDVSNWGALAYGNNAHMYINYGHAGNVYPNLHIGQSSTQPDNNTGTYTDTMTLDGVGNVGVGNMSPAHRLDVSGNINTTTGYYVNGVPLATGVIWTVTNGGNAAYNILAGDNHVRTGTTLTADRTWVLPVCSGANIGERHEIKNTPSQTFNIILDGNGTDLIDGNLTVTLLPGDSYQVICAVAGTWDIE